MSIEEGERAKSHQERPLFLFRTIVDREKEAELIQIVSESTSDSNSGLTKDLSHVAIPNAPDKKRHFSNKQPPLYRHDEARPVELFYDLFFVANLATYTAQNDITNINGMANYIGFFAVLWFTWAQVSLYDVRFSRDSVFDRICKAAHFGVMIGFSFIAYNFDPSGQIKTHGRTGTVDGKALSLILMSSRLILTFQYLLSLISLRKYREAYTPLITMGVSCFIAAMLYLGVSFKFGPDGALDDNSTAYTSWYIILVAETLVVFIVSSIWRSVSFKGTHLCERFSLLTLIVLGEGILGLSRGVVYVWGNTTYYPSLGAAVLSAVLLIYSFFQLYFDTIAQEHFGSIRQQIWAALHFPFHLALILFDEGVKQFIVWNTTIRQEKDFDQAIKKASIVNEMFFKWSYNPTGYSFGSLNNTEYFQSQSEQLWKSYKDFTNPNVTNAGTNVKNYVNETLLTEFADVVATGVNKTASEVAEGVIGFYITVAIGIFENFKIKASYDNIGIDALAVKEYSSLIDEAAGVLSLYDMVYRYLYIGTGCALLIMLVLWILSKTSKNTAFDYVRFVYWGLTGLAVANLCFIDFKKSPFQEEVTNFINGPWVLPVPMILIVVLLVVFHLPFGSNRQQLKDSKV